MHVSKDASPLVFSDPRCYFSESNNVIEIVMHQPMLWFCVAHPIFDQEQEDVSKGV